MMSFDMVGNMNGAVGSLPSVNTFVTPSSSVWQPSSCAVTLNIRSK